MITNDERSKVASRLRAIEFDLETESALEIELERFYNALECNLGQMNWGLNPYKYLADLIEPEPERTCKMTKKGPEYVLGGWCECSECGIAYPPCNDEISTWALQYCPHCGAKVVD